MDFLLWLESSALVDWMLTTTWFYPWVISFHSIGMGFLVGIVLIIVLRVLGFGSFSIAPLEKYLLIVRIAFGVSLATGIALFLLEAQQFFFSPTFRIKLLFIVLGGITGLMLSRVVFSDEAAWAKQGDAPRAVKAIAVASLVCWTVAIFAGRLTAYLP